jgi:PPOX class probable F420-dependent enzyme
MSVAVVLRASVTLLDAVSQAHLVERSVASCTHCLRKNTYMAEIPASHHDLVENTQVITLATVGLDGFPQVTAVGFLLEDGTIKLSLNTARQKMKNLQRHPEATLFFIDPANPYRTLEIRARSVVEPDTDYAFADRLGAKYGGTDLRAMDRAGGQRMVVSFDPVKVNTFG